MQITLGENAKASSRRELAREHHRCGIGGTASRCLHLVCGLEDELVHNASGSARPIGLRLRSRSPCEFC